MRRKWTNEEEKFLVEQYNKLANKEIAEALNRSVNSIQNKAERLGVKIETLNKNDEYFLFIDTNEKAYWLGFIYADGYVINNPRKRNYCLGIELRRQDEEHLYNFAKSIQFNGKIYRRERSFDDINFKSESYSSSLLRIHSKKLVESLEAWGITPNKTHRATDIFSKIPERHKFSFIAGWYDGDGHTYLDNEYIRSRSKIGFTSVDVNYLIEVQSFLSENSIESTIAKNNKIQEGSTHLQKFQLKIDKNSSKQKFLEIILNIQDIPLLKRKLIKNKTLYNAL